MKKVLFVLMLAFTLIFTSCVREESNLQTEFELTSEEFYNKVNDSFQYGFYYSKPIVIKFTETNPDMEIISKACYDFSIPLKITFDFSDCAELSEIPANWFKESLYYTDFTFIFPESLETINDYAFYGLRATKKSPIPNGVKTLGTGCYPYYSDYINSITIPSSVETLSEGIFEYYSNLESIIFPEDCKITEIPANAFHGCYNLKRINIPTSVTKIGEQAFYNSGKLENVKLPDNLTSEISRLTFAATEIGTLTIPGTYKKLDNSNFNSTTIDNVILEDGIEYLGSDLFGYGSNLKTITIPSSVTYISPLFNRSCEKLEEIVLADGNTVYSYDISGALKS